MMDQKVIDELKQMEHTKFHKDLLQHCKALVSMSRSSISDYYDAWDRQDRTYRGVLSEDKEDRKAAERKEPTRAVMPITKAQVDTFVAFGMSVLFQRDRFFELSPFGSDNAAAAKSAEALLQRDLDHSNAHNVVYQFLHDIGKFGVGVLKNSWLEEHQIVKKTIRPEAATFLGIQLPFQNTQERTEFEKVIKYQGNEVANVSPYRFFPDPRYPVRHLQRGEFVATEDEMSYVELKGLQADGVVSGVKHIETLTQKAVEMRAGSRLKYTKISTQGGEFGEVISRDGSVAVVTEIIVKLCPRDWQLQDGTLLGEEDRPIKYLVWYANDNRIIRAEPYMSGHDEFPFFVAQLNPDQHHFINEGIAGNLEQLQSIITWLINSHITSVRKVIQNRLVVDPAGVNMDDLTARRPVIRLKPGQSRSGVERWIKQLDVNDVTANHVTDARAMHDLVQISTGISENSLGQFHTGRRSAREAGQVQSAVAARLKAVLGVVYYGAIQPLGKQMLMNLREGLSAEVYVRLFGVAARPEDYLDFAKVSKADLVGDYDFEIFDGTLPTEKNVIAQTVQEVLLVLMTNPQMPLITGLDIRELFFELMRLKGIRHPERFQVGFEQQVKLLKLIQGLQAQQTQPNEQSNGEVSRSNGGPQNGAPAGTAEPSGLQVLGGGSSR